MTLNLADLHRSRLETLLAVEIEYQKKVLALSNQRIKEIKKLLTDVDALHQDPEGDELLSSDTEDAAAPDAAPAPKKNGKKKPHSKAQPPAKPLKLSAGKAPRLIDALQMVIRNKKLGAKEIHALLKARNWLPNSKDPLGYIRFTLSSESAIFHRVDGARGVYELESNNPYYSGKAHVQAKPPPKAETIEVEDPPKSSPKSSPKAAVAPSPPGGDSEPPPSMSDEDSHEVVEAILNGNIPVDS